MQVIIYFLEISNVKRKLNRYFYFQNSKSDGPQCFDQIIKKKKTYERQIAFVSCCFLLFLIFDPGGFFLLSVTLLGHGGSKKFTDFHPGDYHSVHTGGRSGREGGSSFLHSSSL